MAGTPGCAWLWRAAEPKRVPHSLWDGGSSIQYNLATTRLTKRTKGTGGFYSQKAQTVGRTDCTCIHRRDAPTTGQGRRGSSFSPVSQSIAARPLGWTGAQGLLFFIVPLLSTNDWTDRQHMYIDGTHRRQGRDAPERVLIGRLCS